MTFTLSLSLSLFNDEQHNLQYTRKKELLLEDNNHFIRIITKSETYKGATMMLFSDVGREKHQTNNSLIRFDIGPRNNAGLEMGWCESIRW